MKKIILFISILTINKAFGQLQTRDSLNYNDLESLEWSGDILAYTTKTNTTFRIGDALILGEPFGFLVFESIYEVVLDKFKPLESTFKWRKVYIERIEVNNKNVMVYAVSKNEQNSFRVKIDLERALKNKEILKSGGGFELVNKEQVSHYLKRAGKLKNISIAIATFSATLVAFPANSDTPEDKKPKIFLPVFGGIVSVVFNIAGNISLKKAGEALE